MILPFISDMQLFSSLLVAGLLIVTWFGISAILHARRRDAVAVRIHVAGSRGKTTVTRLLGAALREAGFKTLTKTTGTDPLLLLPDGREQSWPRWAPPSISEQIRFFRRAGKEQAQAVVLESMAIEPEYLWASERYLVHATHTVITNARPDHAEVVGNEPLAAAHALSLVLPRNGKLVVADEAADGPISARMLAAADGKARMQVVATAGKHHDIVNRELALAVTRDLGIADDVAIAGFDKAGEDPGAFFVKSGVIEGRPFRFANAFSCNDPLSLAQLWEENAGPERQVILFNPRADRPERTRAFLSALPGLKPPVQQVYVAGFVPARWVRQAGLPTDTVRKLPTRDPAKAIAFLADIAGPEGLIWGTGNYSRFGKGIIKLLNQLEERPC